MAQFLPLEQTVLRLIDQHQLRDKQFVLLVSGGLDSMVLLEVFKHLSPLFSHQPRVICVHHQTLGENPKSKQNRFRLKSLRAVQAKAQALGFEFLTNFGAFEWTSQSQSEADLRSFRKMVVQALTGDDVHQVVVTGHHLDDQLETQIHRLIRGTGPKGLRAMSIFGAHTFRPFLKTERSELEAYAKRKKVQFVEDPSNQSLKYFRNWLRLHWLPELEKRSPGSKKSLARSIRVLSESLSLSAVAGLQLKSSVTAAVLDSGVNSDFNSTTNLNDQSESGHASNEGFSIEVASYLQLNSTVKKLKIYQWLVSFQSAKRTHASQRAQHVTSQIVEEVLRQLERAILDKTRPEHTFNAGGVTWLVTGNTSDRFILCFSDKGPEHTETSKGFVFTS